MRTTPDSERLLAIACAVLTVALLLVGLVSRTPLRHALQATPPALAALLAWRRVRWAPCCALAVSLFWLFIMTLIWLFLLGLARVVSGHFSVAEIALTLVIGASSVVASVAALRARPPAGLAARAVGFVVFALLQAGALWLSLQPFVARR
jgi:hypothetical protein